LQVKALHAKGYRNLDTTVGLCSPLAVLVGENNAGKSNVIDGLRTVLEQEAGPRHRSWLRPEDFTHDGRGGDPLTGELELAVELDRPHQRGEGPNGDLPGAEGRT
jgi:predicted ATP-dependent endonuclease of OLD family